VSIPVLNCRFFAQPPGNQDTNAPFHTRFGKFAGLLESAATINLKASNFPSETLFREP
jgi:hypothetical protein